MKSMISSSIKVNIDMLKFELFENVDESLIEKI